jgi:excisionase family DNA binding protein
MDMNRNAFESYVSPDEAAAFLKTNRIKIIRMARSGALPAHPLGTGRRHQWRFKLSELDVHMQRDIHTADPPVRQ